MGKQLSVPIVGQYNTRLSATNVVPAASGVIGIGVVGTFKIGQASQGSNKDERFINCFLTKMGQKEYIVKRPGFAALNTPATGQIGNDIHVWSGVSQKIISAFGGTNSSIYDGTSRLLTNGTSTTAITGKVNSITETVVSGTPNVYITSTDNTAWYYSNGGTVTKITAASFPGNNSLVLAGAGAHMDGFTFQMDTAGSIWNSDLNSISAWSASSSIPCNSYPDAGVAAVKFKTYIMGIGTESIQFFRNAGNPFGSPLKRVEEMTVRIGAIGYDAIATLSDSVFFCGATPQGGLSIFQYDGNLSRISNPEQDFQLSLAGSTGIYLTTLRTIGRSFVIVLAGSTTYCYCIEDKRWHEWTSSSIAWHKCVGLSSGSQILTYSISKTLTTGSVYLINPASMVYTDDGNAWTASFQSAEDDSGTGNRKFYGELWVDADVEPASSLLTVQSSDDDYGTWYQHGTIDLSAQTRLTRLGSSSKANGHRRAWQFANSSNAAMRIAKINYTADFGR